MGSCCSNRRNHYNDDAYVSNSLATNGNDNFIANNYNTEQINEDLLKETFFNAEKNNNLKTLVSLLDNKSILVLDDNFNKEMKKMWMKSPTTLSELVAYKIYVIISEKINFLKFNNEKIEEFIAEINDLMLVDVFINHVSCFCENHVNIISKLSFCSDDNEDDEFTKSYKYSVNNMLGLRSSDEFNLEGFTCNNLNENNGWYSSNGSISIKSIIEIKKNECKECKDIENNTFRDAHNYNINNLSSKMTCYDSNSTDTISLSNNRIALNYLNNANNKNDNNSNHNDNENNNDINFSLCKLDYFLLTLTKLSSFKQIIERFLMKEGTFDILIEYLIIMQDDSTTESNNINSNINSNTNISNKIKTKQHLILILQLLRNIFVINTQLRKRFISEGGLNVLMSLIKNISDFDILLEVVYSVQDLIYVSNYNNLLYCI